MKKIFFDNAATTKVDEKVLETILPYFSEKYGNASSQHLIGDEAKNLLQLAMSELGMSTRAYHRILKVARTIADLADSENIQTEHVSEAIQYRALDRTAQ